VLTDVQRAPASRTNFIPPRSRIGIFRLGSEGFPYVGCKNPKIRRPKQPDAAVAGVLRGVSPAALFASSICSRSSPLHRGPPSHVRDRDCYSTSVRGFGTRPRYKAATTKIVVTIGGPRRALSLLGVQYDSSRNPGADDNRQCHRVCLECGEFAQKIATSARPQPSLFTARKTPTGRIPEFVASLRAIRLERLRRLTSSSGGLLQPRSVRSGCPGLPGVAAPDVGDFSAFLAKPPLQRDCTRRNALAPPTGPQPEVRPEGPLGIEPLFRPHANRSDHAPFWQAGIPAVMWTDTSELRNPQLPLRVGHADTRTLIHGEVTKCAGGWFTGFG